MCGGLVTQLNRCRTLLKVVIKGTFSISIQDCLLHINLLPLYIFWHVNWSFFQLLKIWGRARVPPARPPATGLLRPLKKQTYFLSKAYCLA